jgi:hypothetical protein
MDPYLEHPNSWSNVHHRLITAIADFLSPYLLPKYQVLVEERVYQTMATDSILVGIPDALVQRTRKVSEEPATTTISSPSSQPITVTLPMPEQVRQGHLEVRDIVTSEVVTVVEVLSPTNKRQGAGRTQYENKRQRILLSTTHLVEIDLLRKWESMPTLDNGNQINYRILVSRQESRPQADLYAFNLSDPIPAFPLPLRLGDIEPVIRLKELLDGVYDRSGYEFVIDYYRDPIPPLSKAEAAWVEVLLRQKGLR